MNIKKLFLLLFLVLLGCGQSQEKPIYLVCNGVETLTNWQDEKSDSESRKVSMSIVLTKERRNVKTDGYVISYKKNAENEGKEIFKDIWIMAIDNTRKIFEENSIDDSSGYKLVSTSQNVVVTPNQISASQLIETDSDNKKLERSEIFSLEVNRVSGQFHLSNLESYPKTHEYKTEAEGQCRKADKTF